MIKLRYDGKYNFLTGENRQWTIVSDAFGPDGANYKGSSRMLEGLRELRII